MDTQRMIGEIACFAFDDTPANWFPCDGRLLDPHRNEYAAICSLLGTQFGSSPNKQLFALPDLRGRTAIGPGQTDKSGPDYVVGKGGGETAHALTPAEMPGHTHAVSASSATADSADPTNAFWASESGKTPYSNVADDGMGAGAVSYTGADQPHENMSPYLALNMSICNIGNFGTREGFIGEIVLFCGTVAPKGWEFCDGQTFAINKNTALFSIIANTYGGDGITTGALPDLRGRAPIGFGKGNGMSDRDLGSTGGSATVELTSGQIPSHNHVATASTQPGNTNEAASGVWAMSGGGTRGGAPAYAAGGNLVAMHPDALSTTGGGEAHNNMPPYLPVQYIICTQGEFPSRG